MSRVLINRLVGSSVLLLVAVLVLPVLLTPKTKLEGTSSVTQNDLNVYEPNIQTGEIQLATDDTELATNENDLVVTEDSKEIDLSVVPEDNNFHVVLESLSEAEDKLVSQLDTTQTEDKSILIGQKPQVHNDWIQIASLVNGDNVNRLVSELKRRNYPVKTESVKVSGQLYQRILVGPYETKADMDKALSDISELTEGK